MKKNKNKNKRTEEETNNEQLSSISTWEEHSNTLMCVAMSIKRIKRVQIPSRIRYLSKTPIPSGETRPKFTRTHAKGSKGQKAKKKKEEEEKKSSLRQKSGRQRCRHVRGRPALPRTWTRRRDKGQHPLSPVIKCHIHSLTAEKETEQLPVMTMIKDAKWATRIYSDAQRPTLSHQSHNWIFVPLQTNTASAASTLFRWWLAAALKALVQRQHQAQTTRSKLVLLFIIQLLFPPPRLCIVCYDFKLDPARLRASTATSDKSDKCLKTRWHRMESKNDVATAGQVLLLLLLDAHKTARRFNTGLSLIELVNLSISCFKCPAEISHFHCIYLQSVAPWGHGRWGWRCRNWISLPLATRSAPHTFSRN